MKQRKTGPFYDLTEEQWAEIRGNHHRFLETRDLGRPLFPCIGVDLNAHEDKLPPDEIVLAGPRERNATVDEALRGQIRLVWLLRHCEPRWDGFPAISIARDLYGHSQRLAEPFGSQLQKSKQHYWAVPSVQSAAAIRYLKPKPAHKCHFLSKSIEWMRYLYESTEGRYFIRQMVTTGPIDTANYITGSTLFLESLYTHPEEVHLLLRMVTDVIIEHILACQEVTGDRIVPDHTCFLKGYALCSELRSEISGEHYEEFEAPYLKEIGEAVGPLIIHASGRWEQSIHATLADPNIFHIVLWVRDTNLRTITGAAGGRISIEAWRSDLEQYGFPDSAAYYRYLFDGLLPETRLAITHLDAEGYNRAYDQLESEGRLPEQIRGHGRLSLPEVRV